MILHILLIIFINVLDFLIKELETRACRLKVSNDHIITCFIQLGVSLEELLDYYDR